jgi:hypothetical protein
MSLSLRDLKRHVDETAPPPFDVESIVARGDARLRRRRAALVAASAGLVAIAIVTSVALTDSKQRSGPPVNTPTPSPTVKDASVDRPLTYAQGETIHYGDQIVETGRRVAAVDVVDAGVLYLNQARELWFTDGSETRRVESGADTEGYEAKPAELGSRIAWVRHKGDLPTEVVVYDAATHQVVLREPAGPSVWPEHDANSPYAQVLLLTPDAVVVTYSDTNYGPGRTSGQSRYVSYDLGTGRSAELSADEVDRLQSAPPARTLGWRARAGTPENVWGGDGNRLVPGADGFVVRGGILTVELFHDSAAVPYVADPVDPVTGDRLRIEVPARVHEGAELRLFQWLDDGVFALVGTSSRMHDVGPLLVCRVSDRQCRVAATGPSSFVLPGQSP